MSATQTVSTIASEPTLLHPDFNLQPTRRQANAPKIVRRGEGQLMRAFGEITALITGEDTDG